MECKVAYTAKIPQLVEEVNDLVAQDWMPLEGGFQVQNFTDASARYLQAMVMISPWSVQAVMGAIKSVSPPTIIFSHQVFFFKGSRSLCFLPIKHLRLFVRPERLESEQSCCADI